MTDRPAEVTAVHPRLMKCALEVEDARAYWPRALSGDVTPDRAFREYWFGSKSLARCKVLLANFRDRFDAYPDALSLLARWRDMAPGTRALIAHWHVQLADPLYRAFTGDYLVERRTGGRSVTRDAVLNWVGDHGPVRWKMASRIQFASKLLSTAYAAGIVSANRDPRPVVAPRVRDDALVYLAYLLRGVDYEGTLLDNPYAASVGLDPEWMAERLGDVPHVRLRRQSDLLDLEWEYPSMAAWADARFEPLETHAERATDDTAPQEHTA